MNPEIFLKAAEISEGAQLADGWRMGYFACHALELAQGGMATARHTDAHDFFEKLFDAVGRCGPWLTDSELTNAQAGTRRIIALSLAYEVAKDEARRARWAKNSWAYRARLTANGGWRLLRNHERIRKGDEFNYCYPSVGLVENSWGKIGSKTQHTRIGRTRASILRETKAGDCYQIRRRVGKGGVS